MSTKSVVLSGAVQNAQGNAIENATVQVDDLNSMSSAWTQTNSQGQYSFIFGMEVVNNRVSCNVTAQRFGFKGNSKRSTTQQGKISVDFTLNSL